MVSNKPKRVKFLGTTTKSSSNSKSSSGQVIRDSIRIGGTLVTGYTDTRTGQFSPDSSSQKDFEQIQKATGTTSTSKLREIAATPEVKKIEQEVKAEIRAQNINITAQMAKSATFREDFVKRIQKGGVITSQDVKTAREIGIKPKDLLKYADNTRKQLQLRQYRTDNVSRQQKQDLFGYYNAQTIKQVDKIAKEQKLNVVQREQLLRNTVKGEQPNFLKSIGKEPKNEISFFDVNKIKSENPFLKALTPKQVKSYVQAQAISQGTTTKSIIDRNNIVRPTQLIGTNLNKFTSEKDKKLFISEFKKMPKEFIKGLGQGLFYGTLDLLLLVPKTLKVAYGYGKGAVIRAEANKTRTIKIFGKDIKNISKSTWNNAKWVKNHPLEATALVGAYAVATKQNLEPQFVKNPYGTIGKAVGYWYSPNVLIKGVSIVAKPFTSKLLATRYKNTSIDFTKNVRTGATNIKGTFEGSLVNNNKFTGSFNLKYSPKTKKLTGVYKTNINGKTTTKKVNLVEKDLYFYNPKTKEKIPKSRIPVIEQKLTETKRTQLAPDRVAIVNNEAFVIRDIQLDKIITAYAKSSKKITTSQVQKRIVISTTSKKAARIIINKIYETSTKKRGSLTKVSSSDVLKAESFLKDIGFDLAKGLDRRRKIASLLGLKAESKKVKEIVEIFDRYGKLKKQYKEITLKGKAVLKEGVIPIKIVKEKFKFSLTNLRKSKKASLSIMENDRILIPKQLKAGKYTSQTISIPKIESFLPLTKSNIRFLKIGSQLLRVTLIINKLLKIQKNPKLYDNVKIQKLIRDLIQTTTRINKQIKAQKIINKKLQKQIKVQKTLKSTKTIQKTAQVVKKVAKLRVSVPKFKEPPIKPIKILKFKDKLPKGYTYAYDAKIRVKGKVKTIKLGLPTNRALSKVGKLIDNTTSRSMQLVPVGIIKKTKDISKPSILGKFRVRKGKKALLLVEKSKYSIDTSGEKKGLSIGKLLSPKKKTKKASKKKIIKKSSSKNKKKVKKTITKTKKSSQKRFKAVKSIKTKRKTKKK